MIHWISGVFVLLTLKAKAITEPAELTMAILIPDSGWLGYNMTYPIIDIAIEDFNRTGQLPNTRIKYVFCDIAVVRTIIIFLPLVNQLIGRRLGGASLTEWGTSTSVVHS